MALEPLAERWRAFGWAVREVDGHDIDALTEAFTPVPHQPTRPTCVIAHTFKGHGVSFMADRVEWHHRVPTMREIAVAARRIGRRVMAAETFDCRVAFAETLLALARVRPPRGRGCQRLRRILEPQGIQEALSRTGSSTSASPSRTWSEWAPGWRNGGLHAVCLRRRPASLPVAPWSRSRRISRYSQSQRQAVRDVERHGLRRARTDAPFHRGPRLDARHRQPHGHRARRSHRNGAVRPGSGCARRSRLPAIESVAGAHRAQC